MRGPGGLISKLLTIKTYIQQERMVHNPRPVREVFFERTLLITPFYLALKKRFLAF